MSNIMDTMLAWLKWPVAGATLALLPGTLLSTWEIISGIMANPWPVIPLAAGAGAYFLIWKLIFKRAVWGTWFSTLEHELTHAVFALVTFHRVTGLRVTYRQGGSMSYEGRSNWLVTISPYFFPTFSVVLLFVLCFTPADKLMFAGGALGVSMGYHMISNIRQMHAGQSDLHEVGFLFALLFLPAANLMCYAGILAFACEGTPGILDFARNIRENTIGIGLEIRG